MSKNKTIQVGDMPIEADTIKARDSRNHPTTNIATTTPTGTHIVDTHHATVKNDHIVHTGDKQPTELHEPKAEKNYKLRDDDKDYEFKPRTEYTKTKDSKLSAWEGQGLKSHHDQKVHVHEHGVHDHGVHEHGVHDHGAHKHGDQDKPGVIEKVKEVKDKVKDKVQEHKEHKQKRPVHEETEVKKVEVGRFKPGYEETDVKKVEVEKFKPGYEETEVKKVEVGKFKPGYEETEFKRVEEKDVPYVRVGKGPVEIVEPRHEKEFKETRVVGKEPVEIHEPREEKEFKRDEDNVHVKLNFNKT
jgi:hypothetical protein